MTRQHSVCLLQPVSCLCAAGQSEIGGGSGREYITVHCAGSASGERLPPFILYKVKNMYRRWMEGGPAAALYGVSESGWMDVTNFLSWFTKLFVPAVSHLTESSAILLFLDGHHSHISLELIRNARDNILLLCLPPNMTHLLQPLDVGVFAPVKSAWKGILKRFKLETRGAQVSKEVFLLLEIRAVRPKVGQRNNLKVRVEGEAITSDEFLDLLETQRAAKEEEKKQKKAKKGKKQKGSVNPRKENSQEGKLTITLKVHIPTYVKFCSYHAEVNENICQECGGNYDDDYQDAWIGCDNEECGRWFH